MQAVLSDDLAPHVLPEELIPSQDLARYGITFTNVHRLRLERAGKFPVRVRLGAARYGYVKREVLAWLAARIAERDAGQSIPPRRVVAKAG